MADRELTLDLLARDKTGQATRSAARNIDDVADAADDAAKSTDRFGRSSTDAAGESEKFGRTARNAKDHVSRLDGEIRRVNQNLVLLAEQMAEADDAAGRIDISKGIRRAEAELRRLTKSRGILAGLIPDNPEPEQARGFGRKLVAAIADGASSFAAVAGANVGRTIGVAAGVAAAPVLIPALSAAVSAGIGGAGIGLGLALAAKDPVVAARGKEVGKKFADGLKKEASEAFQGPVLESLRRLDAAGARITTKLGTAFDALADDVGPLTDKLTVAGERLTDSFVKSARSSGPALDALGDSVVLLSDGVGDFIDIMSEGGPEAAANLRLIAGATADVARTTGNFLGVLTKLSASPWLTGPLVPILRKHYGDLADEQTHVGTSAGQMGAGVGGAAKKLQLTTLAAQGNREALAALNTELRAQADPLFAFVTAQDRVREAQGKLNKAIKEHGPNSRQAAAATRDLATSALDLQGKAAAAGATADGKLTPAMRRALQQAGLTEGQIRRVGGELGRAKGKLDSYDGTRARATVSADTRQAAAALRTVRNAVNALDGRVINVGVHVAQSISRVGAAIKSRGYSTGGYVDGPGSATSDSIPARLSKGEFVVRAATVSRPGVRQLLESLETGGVAAPRQAAAGGVAGGGGVTTMRLIVEPAPGASRAFVEMHRYSLRTAGGDAPAVRSF